MPRLSTSLLVCAAVALGSTVASPDALAGERGRTVTVHVVDTLGNPIKNANVRVPGTEGRTRVNGNGDWTITEKDKLYTVEGDEFLFTKNLMAEFHVSAPEFHARSVQYRIRGRMNYVTVALRKMPEPTEPLEKTDDQDLLIRWFQRTEVEEAPEGAPPPDRAPEPEGG
tara:strand:- start:72 stop:578 length:507 start_codon:yes stop_codon:yes gene_type:complete